MSSEDIRSGVTVLAAILGSGIVGVLLHYRAQNAKTKAQAIKINAEAKALGVDDQTDVINNLRLEVGRLAARVEELETKYSVTASRNNSLREALLLITHWVARVWIVLTPEQRAEVGPPPETDHLLRDPTREN